MQTLSYNIFKFSLLILFLQSMFAWFLWGQLVFAVIFSVLSTVFFASINKGVFIFKKSTFLPVFLMIFIQLYVVRDMNINAFIASILRIIIITIVLFLNDEIKIKIFKFLTNSLAIILLISMIAWVLYLVGIALPYTFVDVNDGQYNFNNYYFFLLNYVGMDLPVPRFSSVFLEPGQLGMITSFLLFANKFEFKRISVLIIFIATIFTFSLAAYVLLFVSATAYLTLNSKNSIKILVFWSALIFILFSFFSTYDNGDNMINNLIFSRLQYENGDISGNNRFSQDLDIYYDRFIASNDVVFGIGSANYSKLSWEGGNAGFKVFLIQYGILGVILIFLTYLFVVFEYRTKMAWILLLVYILSFLQASYALWECELLIFITVMPYFKLNMKKKDES